MPRTIATRQADRRTTNAAQLLRALALAAGTLLATSCGDGETTTAGGAAEPAELNVAIWSEYLPQEVVDAFTAESGIRVNVDLYDSNEALLAKLQSGVTEFDLAVPSDYMVPILIGQGLLRPLERERIPNVVHLDPQLLDRPFDPGNRHTLPYLWGTTGLAYDRAKLGEVDSWNAVFDPTHRGRILMLDDMREVFGVALRTLGRSINTTDPAVLAEAAALLKRQKELVATYDSGDFANVLAAGDVDLAHGFNGQLAKAVRDEPQRLAFTIPREGGTLWLDSLTIPTASRHPLNAHRFIDYLHRPEVAARIVAHVHYASGNLAAREHIPREILDDRAIYPDEATRARCELLSDLGETTTLLDRYWTEIKAQ